MKTFKIITLGCRTNQYESAAYHNQLVQLGSKKVEEKPDFYIINTCTVTASADQKSLASVRRVRREDPEARVIVTGCAAKKNRKRLEVDNSVLVVDNEEKERLIEKVFPELENYPEFSIDKFHARTRAFIKVQDGCNSYCSYCIIPFVRGRSRSRSIESIEREASLLVTNGYQEIVVTGINVGDFDGGDGSKRLSDIVYSLEKIEGLKRIRISSIDPDEVEDDLIEAISTSKKASHSMHIVLQAGSNRILKRMNRKYTKQDFLKTVRRLRDVFPDFTFTTDLIVGFPGESEDDFEESLSMIREVGFAKVHMFPYSKREGTRAARFSDVIEKEEMENRRQRVLKESEKSAMKVREKFLGRTMDVLLESIEGDFMLGHTDNFLMVRVTKSAKLRTNQICKVKMIENSDNFLIGKVL